MVKHTNGSYIICNGNQIEQRGFVNPDPPAATQYQQQQHQLQKATIQRNNSNALEMYGLVNKITGRSDIYDNIETMTTAAYPHQGQYLKASEQQQRSNNNNRNAIEMYEMIQSLFGGGNNINGW